MPVTYEDLNGQDGSFENPGGTDQLVYYAPISDFETLVAPPAFSSITDIESAAVIDGTGTPHAFKTGKKFNKMRLNVDQGSVDGEVVGEPGGQSIRTLFSGQIIEGAKKLFGFQRVSKEDQYILLIPLPDGSVIQVGTEKKPAKMKVTTTTGKNNEGVRSGNVEVHAIDVATWLYEGDIAETPAA